MNTSEAYAKACKYTGILPVSFIGGSYLVNPDTCNDIDIVVPSRDWAMLIALHPEYLKDNGLNPVMVNRDEQEENYGDEHEMYELITTYRDGDVNLLIIRDDFIPAYRCAALQMTAEPERFTSREQRVELHQRHKQVIRNMLDGSHDNPMSPSFL